MIKSVFLAMAFFLTVFGVTKSFAETQMTTDRLYQLCAFDAQGKELVENGQTACQSYIIGVVDYYKTLKALNGITGVEFCLPDGVTDFDLQEKVLLYIGENARHKGFLAAPTVALALQNSYPCSK